MKNRSKNSGKNNHSKKRKIGLKNNVLDEPRSITKGGNKHMASNLLDDYEASGLSIAKTNWYFGEWQALIEIDIERLRNHPSIDKLAILKAAGYQQINDIDNCKKYVAVAKLLGCDEKTIAKVLIAGVHNVLGKLAALKEDDVKTKHHFDAAVDIGEERRESKLARHARSVKEISKLGLLPQAAKLLSDEKERANSWKNRPSDNESTMKVLSSEVEIINHELALAYQKSQLYANFNEDKSIYNEDGSINERRLKQLSPSQLGQDLWVLSQTNYKKQGFFVEFGATDGVLLSNTYLLEKEFGWRGLCAEPNPKLFAQLKNNRNCTVSDACIADISGKEVQFILANEYGGIADFANNDGHSDKREAYAKTGNIIKLTTISLHEFLLINNAPEKIDYMSVDTEGSEFSILNSFPFEKWDIKLFSIEHNFTPQRIETCALLESQGYKCVEAQFDDWFIKV